jgi:hypothetical protein
MSTYRLAYFLRFHRALIMTPRKLLRLSPLNRPSDKLPLFWLFIRAVNTRRNHGLKFDAIAIELADANLWLYRLFYYYYFV